MTRPPPPRRHTGPALAACAVLSTTALGFLVGHGNTSAAAVRAVMPLPGVPTRSEPAGASQIPQGVSVVPTTLYRTATVTSWRSRTISVTAAPRTVFATRTATATVTAVQTVTATATQTVTQTATTTVTATATVTETAVPTP